MNLSDEERERRRQQALALHREGRLGGAQFGRLGGRPKKKRASEIVAEKVSQEADLIWSALKDSAQPDQPAYVRLQAVRQMLEIERAELQITQEEERQLERLQRDELIAAVQEGLTKLQEANIVKRFEGPALPVGDAGSSSDGETLEGFGEEVESEWTDE